MRVYERRDSDSLYIEWFGDGRRWQKNLKSIVGVAVDTKRDAVRYAHQLSKKLGTAGATGITDAMMQDYADRGRDDAVAERLILPEDELFSHELPAKHLCGIYFLIDAQGLVMYVGQSTNIMSRLATHLYRTGVFIARVAYQPFDEADLNRAEAFYIHRFQPPDNVKYPPVKAEDEALLASLEEDS